MEESTFLWGLTFFCVRCPDAVPICMIVLPAGQSSRASLVAVLNSEKTGKPENKTGLVG